MKSWKLDQNIQLTGSDQPDRIFIQTPNPYFRERPEEAINYIQGKKRKKIKP